MKLDFEIIKELLVQGNLSTGIVDPGKSPILSSAGVGLITNYIQQLALLSLVDKPTPLFGKDGNMWIGYSLTSKGRELVHDEEAMKLAVAELIGGPKNEISQSIYSLLEECRSKEICAAYREDFLKTMEEIAICFDNECYIATLSLSGKILEICLKEILGRFEITIDTNSNIGTLLRKIRESDEDKRYYLDPGLQNIANIINTSRNTAIHANQSIPVPSRDQVIMVLFALRDVVRRFLT